ncbi:hypothetical protein FRC08_014036 [Ceratobasidium sp. 394]|nr:hypothetical protein FRC08_014036 [Ceratobasidium sp. 394]
MDQIRGECFGCARTRRKRDAHISSGTTLARAAGKVLQLELNHGTPRISASSVINRAIGAMRVQTTMPTQGDIIELKETEAPKETASSVISRGIGATHARMEMQERVLGEDGDKDEAVAEEEAPPNLEIAEGAGGEDPSLPLGLQTTIDFRVMLYMGS